MGPKGIRWLHENLIYKENKFQVAYHNTHQRMPPMLQSMLPRPERIRSESDSMLNSHVFWILRELEALKEDTLCDLLDPVIHNESTRYDVYIQLPMVFHVSGPYPRVIDILNQNLTSSTPMDRLESAYILAKLQNQENQSKKLTSILTDELLKNTEKAQHALLLLGNLGPLAMDAIPVLEKLLNDDQSQISPKKIQSTIYKISGRSFLDTTNDPQDGEGDQ